MQQPSPVEMSLYGNKEQQINRISGTAAVIPQGEAIQGDNAEEHLQDRHDEFQGRCLIWKGRLGRMNLCFNPLSTISAAVIVWVIIAWAIKQKSSIEYFNEAQRWITDKCTWLYVATQTTWAALIIFIYFKYGHLKLGLPNDIPAYSNFDYFAMVFTAGLSAGIVYDGVATPIALYTNTTSGKALNYWGKTNDGNKAQNAINIMAFHYGFHGICVYLIVGLLIGTLAHRKGLPLTMRTCFYPLFGNKIFGRLGDIVDGISMITITFGVSTSFLIGSVLLIVGLSQLASTVKTNTTNYVIATWIITLMSSVSAMSGLKLGIRRMSQLCFVSGVMFFAVIVFSDDVWFVLNLLVQSLGYYFQYLIGMSGYTGAFEQKGNLPNQNEPDKNWMHYFTVFYWGWWIGWAPLVGIFIARLSKGRYIRDVIKYGFFLPIVTSFVWLVGMGGLSIEMEHRAAKYSVFCDDRPQNLPKWVFLYKCTNGTKNHFYALINMYEDITGFLHALALAIIVFYYITTFDTSALVMDIISSNGEKHPPLSQRIFWCFTIGATTTAFAYYENDKGLNRVHAFAVICGLPFNIILCIISMALLRLLRKEPGWTFYMDTQWEMLYGNVNSLSLFKKTIITLFFPWYYLGMVAIIKKDIQQTTQRILTFLIYAIPFYLWIALMSMSKKYKNVDSIGWAVVLGLVIYSSMLRRSVRRRYIIEGNIFEDICLMLIYPITIVQMYVQINVVPADHAGSFPRAGEAEIQSQFGAGIDNLGHEYNNNQRQDSTSEISSPHDQMASPIKKMEPFEV